MADRWMQLLYVDRHDDTNRKFSYPHRSLPKGASTAWKADRYTSAEDQEDAGRTDEFMMECMEKYVCVYVKYSFPSFERRIKWRLQIAALIKSAVDALHEYDHHLPRTFLM